MIKQEAISEMYKLRNEAYAQLDALNHPDFHYWNDDKIKWQTKLDCYDKFLNILISIN